MTARKDPLHQLQTLLEKYKQGTCTPAERQQIDDLVDNFDNGNAEWDTMPEADRAALLNQLQGEIVHSVRRYERPAVTRAWLPYTIAAAVLVAVIGVGWMLFSKSTNIHTADMASVHVGPGSNKATLTLADGRTIELDEKQGGIAVGDGISYLDGGQLIESDELNVQSKTPGSGPPVFNAIATPKGGTYRIVLPDGTRVWLNAVSKLEYPAEFSADKRQVAVTGEAYFEVAEDKNKPFVVTSHGQTIHVLGTSFNVHAYADEGATVTTLVDGSLMVTSNDNTNPSRSQVMLAPGEKSVQLDGRLDKQKADIESETAWKNGYFVLNQATMQTIASQISRWYNIEVECIDLPHQTFSAEIPRSVKLSTLLEVIEASSDYQYKFIYERDKQGERRLIITTK